MNLLKVVLAACLSLPMLTVAPFSSAAGDPTQATVIKTVKKVEWQRARTKAWQKANLDTLLFAGDTLRTGTDAKAELRYGDGSVTRVGSLSTLTLVEDGRREIRLESGRVWLQIQKGGAGMRVITPGAVAAVTGTEFMVEFDPTRKVTEVTVFEGSVNVSGDIGRFVRVLQGTTTIVPPRAPASVPVPAPRSKVEVRDSIFKPLSVEGTPEAATPETKDPEAKTPETKDPETKDPEVKSPETKDPAVPVSAPTPAPTTAPVTDAGAPTPAPAATTAPGKGVSPDLKNQTDKLLDPRILNGSPTTGRVKVIIE